MKNKGISREELINGIKNIRPSILKVEELENLAYEDLLLIYRNNVGRNYYKSLIHYQKVSAIRYVYEERYSLVYIYKLNEEEFEELYLQAIKMTKPQFEQMVADGLEEFRERAIAEGNEEYLAFTIDEQIIASSVLTPSDLLTEEEFITKSVLFRINEITTEIEELKADNESTEEMLRNTTNYMAVSEFRNDISSNNRRIGRLEEELRKLMNPNGSDTMVRKRTDGQPH